MTYSPTRPRRDSLGTSTSFRSSSRAASGALGGGAGPARPPVEAILADLYGEQKLLRDGVIPPALVFSDPSFLGPCHGLVPSRAICSSLPSTWRADRTAAGASSTRIPRRRPASATRWPTAWCTPMSPATSSRPARPCAWRRSFSSCRPSLARRANRVDPTIALLTPGPRHNDYFSHAYLARYLGFCWSRAETCASPATACSSRRSTA